MALHQFKKGLDLPITGTPSNEIEDAPQPRTVAVVAADYPGMKPGMKVAEGDAVRLGQPLFEDKKQPGVIFTSPGSGTVVKVNRGAKRALQTVVVRLDQRDRGDGTDTASFSSFTGRHPSSLERAEVRELLCESGLWTALRGRPYGRVAAPEAVPHSIFVNAMDSSPLAPDLELVAAERSSDLERGLAALQRLTDGPVYFCRAAGSKIQPPASDQVQVEEFAGPHPAGTVGLHIHTLDPVDRNKLVWHLALQDVWAIGRLFETGRLDVRNVISIGGPLVQHPRHLRSRIGASTEDVVAGELFQEANGAEHRIVSGSALAGRIAQGDTLGFLGRYHQQITVLPECSGREFIGWLKPGADRHSVSGLFLSRLTPAKRFDMDTGTHGSSRAILPFGLYEKVMPFDLMPTFLLKAIVTRDLEQAEELGVLELDEEDLALCTYVCPGKNEYGPQLRELLTTLEKEG